jgi:hypothetical protein
MVEGKPSLSCGPMLVTAAGSKQAAIQLRDFVLEANGFAKVQEFCTLKDKLRMELLSMGYSYDIDTHVFQFIRGLFGKTHMRLFIWWR